MVDLLYAITAVVLYGIARHSVDVMAVTCKAKRNLDLDNKITDSWMFREIVLRNSSSKLDCAVRCAKDPSCVTYMVNLDSGICRFYGARITRYNTLVNAQGFKSYDNCRAGNVFGNICSQDSDCLLANSVCIGNTCQCNDGWSYSPNSLTCVRDCTQYGSEFTRHAHAYIVDNNQGIWPGAQYLTPQGCANMCETATAFVCRSFDLDFEVSACKLANVTPFHVAPSMFVSGSAYNVDYYQRHCQYTG